MNGDRAAEILLYGVMLLLPLSALIARRPALGTTFRMAMAWVAIFAIGLLLVSQRHRLPDLFSDQRVSGSETRIAMAADGHFWADVSIDGVRRRMLIDSGATTTAVSVATAKAAGIDIGESPFATIVATANGTISARAATAHRLVIGSITADDLGVVVSPSFGDTDVIGMNFLSRLRSWRVEQGTLVLTPK